MYAIREDLQNSRLRITLSGRVPTDEALRAVRQAAMLLRTDSLNEVICDVTLVERGPGKLLLLAAMMAREFPPMARLAVVSGDWQLMVTQRVLRFSGLGSKVRCFTEEAIAYEWLASRENALVPVSTEARHLEFVSSDMAHRARTAGVEKVGPAA